MNSNESIRIDVKVFSKDFQSVTGKTIISLKNVTFVVFCVLFKLESPMLL